jgi:hypothetical protein
MSDELFCGLTEKTIEQYSPAIAASEVIIHLRILVEITQGYGKGAFHKRYGDYFLKNRLRFSDSSLLEANIPIFTGQEPELWARERNSAYICVAYVFALEAIDEDKAGRLQHAWVLATQAKVYLGTAVGSDSSIVMPKAVRKHQGSKGGKKSKEAEIYSKEVAIEYYQKHITEFDGQADAIRKITEKKLVLEKPRAIRDWIHKFHKENPDIPKPTKKPKSV